MMQPVLKDCGCTPTAYDGGSTALIHSPNCEKYPEQGLTGEQRRDWKAQCRAIKSLHPVLARPPRIAPIIPFPVVKDTWHLDSPTCGCTRCLSGDGIVLAKHKPAPVRPKGGI